MIKAVYTEDIYTMCEKCCINKVCSQDGFCKCDEYRYNNNIFDLEGDFYFVEED